ncbi:MAG: hypothetical protein JKX72_12675, partial [Robiginitomaculum sp.]|nr:hypothetical protein [Robiginitomaculum sp.]
GSDKHDIIVGNAWNNELIGGAGNDTLYGDGVVFDGDAGFRDADALASSSATPWGTNGVAPDSNDSGDDILRGGKGHDILKAGLGNNEVYGGEGQDEITIADGASGTYDGGIGNDTFIVKETGNIDTSILKLIGGSGDNDKITFEGGSYVSDQRDPDHVKLLTGDGTFEAELDGFEEVHIKVGRVLPNINANYTLTGGPAYDYSFADSSAGGANFDITIYTYINQDSFFDYTFRRIVATNVDINGFDHDGTTLDRTVSGSSTHSLHSSLDGTSVGSFYGTNNGDTISIHKAISGSVAASAGSLSFVLGTGNDTVEISRVSTDKFGFTYKGGNDTITYTETGSAFYGETVGINMSFTRAETGVAFSTNSSGQLSDVVLTTPKGTLTITGLTPQIRFSDGEILTFDTLGNQTITTNPSTLHIEGAWTSDTYIHTDNISRGYFTLGGDDVVLAGSGDDFIYGFSGNNQLFGGAGDDLINGGVDYDRLDGGTGFNTLSGGKGDDIIFVGEGSDSVTGGLGNDRIVVKSNASGSAYITDFDLNDDILDLSNVSDISSFASLNFSQSGSDTNISVEGGSFQITIANTNAGNLSESNFAFGTGGGGGAFTNTLPLVPSTVNPGGTASDDTLFATDFDGEVIYGYAGNDALYGNLGNDYLYGGDGDDYELNGGGGNDVLIGGDGSDQLAGDIGDDFYIMNIETDGGFDGIWDIGGTDALVLNGNITTSEITFNQFENNLEIYSTNYTTAWQGTNIYDYFAAPYFAGEEYKVEYIVIQDVVYDLEDVYNTGLWTPYGTGNATSGLILPPIPTTVQTGDSSGEVMEAFSVDGEALYGLGGNDWLYGGDGDDYLYGGDGDDELYGDYGSDVLIGGAGDDDLYGFEGDHFYIMDIDSDLGFDSIYDNGGTDTLVLNGNILTSDIALTVFGNTLRVSSTGFTLWQGVDIYDFFSGPYVAGEEYKVEYIVIQDVIYDLEDVYNTGVWTPLVTGTGGNGPNAFDDFITIEGGGAFTGNVLANNGNGVDYDTDGSFLEVIPFSQTGAYGTLDVAADGSISIVAPENYVGTHTFSYTVLNFAGNGSQATVQLDFVAANSAPIAGFIGFEEYVEEGTGLSFTPTFTDADGDTLTYSMSMQDGSVVPNFSIDPNTGLISGTAPIGYASYPIRITAFDGEAEVTHDMNIVTYIVSQGTVNVDYIHGGTGVDIIYGDDGDDHLYGYDSYDELYGEAGNDYLYGYEGDDDLNGGAGDDHLYGNEGNDALYGGAGSDTIYG